MKPVLVTTEYRGVFAGLILNDADMTARAMPIKDAKMAIYWGTTKGVMELCESGPTSKSKISSKADIPMLHGITAVFEISPEAWKKWEAA